MSSIFLVFCRIGRTVFEFKGQPYNYSFLQSLQLQSTLSFLIIFPESTTSNSNIKFYSDFCCQHCCAFILCSLGPANRLRIMSLTFIVIYLRHFPVSELYFRLILHLEVFSSCFLTRIQTAAFWIVGGRSSRMDFNFTSSWNRNGASSTRARTTDHWVC